ncbi:MAG TPA: GNAT family N-acetyltransferase [Candidatus Atribacteria bacterium]|nr:GNAT family N-acetyltransferase [Candidatus Atribacteria bacterium]HPT77581.1 GNAT family N-acetyltransferase [Candidatus Atribacteria bacterium]
MEGPRPVKKEELSQVLELINSVFRTNEGLAPTMGEEFPLLLCEKNAPNMRVILEDGRPVSSVNYYPATVSIRGARVRVASVGSVCTHPDHRGRNYASILLEDAESSMVREGIEIMLVSGSRSLYLRRSCVKTGGFFECTISSDDTKAWDWADDVDLLEINEGNIIEAANIYSNEPVRFDRTFDEYKGFFKGAMTPWGRYSFISYLIRIRQRPAAYIFARLEEGKGSAYVREFAGDRSLVLQGMGRLLKRHGLGEIKLVVHKQDVLAALLEASDIELKDINQQGTVKILNFPSLMNSLKPYMRLYLPEKTVDGLRFGTSGDTYIFEAGDERIAINGMNALCRLVFGEAEQEVGLEGLKAELARKPRLEEILGSVFPIPFPWTQNMNYI